MKKIICIIFATAILFPIFSFAASVDGYWRDSNHDGVKDTYVQSHQRTDPNTSRTDNYGYPGNYNPNSGGYTPQSNSPRQTYPSNPNPYQKRY